MKKLFATLVFAALLALVACDVEVPMDNTPQAVAVQSVQTNLQRLKSDKTYFNSQCDTALGEIPWMSFEIDGVYITPSDTKRVADETRCCKVGDLGVHSMQVHDCLSVEQLARHIEQKALTSLKYSP